jgi:hypothetical protein
MPSTEQPAESLAGLRAQLEHAGFSFHERTSKFHDGEYWWCWCGPLGFWDVESGSYMRTEADTELDALRHMIWYLKLAQAVMDDKGIVA